MAGCFTIPKLDIPGGARCPEGIMPLSPYAAAARHVDHRVSARARKSSARFVARATIRTRCECMATSCCQPTNCCATMGERRPISQAGTALRHRGRTGAPIGHYRSQAARFDSDGA